MVMLFMLEHIKALQKIIDNNLKIMVYIKNKTTYKEVFEGLNQPTVILMFINIAISLNRLDGVDARQNNNINID